MKKAIRKLKLTKYMENFYNILFTVTGKQPPYIKREIEDKIVRMFEMIDRVWCSIERDRRRSFLNYYYILFKLSWTKASSYPKCLYSEPAYDFVSTTSSGRRCVMSWAGRGSKQR